MSVGERHAYLAAQRMCRVATVGAAGRPHVTPLWFVWIPEPAGLWLYSITRSQRWADLRRRPWASVVVDSGTSYAELRGVEVGGPASVMGEVPRVGEPAEEFRAVESACAAKYLAAGLMRHDGRHGWLRLVPEMLVSWDFTKLATLGRPGRAERSTMSFTFPVEAGHILMFARAIGDANPVYADAERAAESEVGGIIAPPTFARACAQFDPDWRLRPRVGEPWRGSGREPTGVPPAASDEGTSLHAEQHFEYYRPLRPGDLLTCSSRPGRTWEKQGRRGGLLRFAETVTEFRDRSGELAVTMRSVSVRTERVVTDEEH